MKVSEIKCRSSSVAFNRKAGTFIITARIDDKIFKAWRANCFCGAPILEWWNWSESKVAEDYERDVQLMVICAGNRVMGVNVHHRILHDDIEVGELIYAGDEPYEFAGAKKEVMLEL